MLRMDGLPGAKERVLALYRRRDPRVRGELAGRLSGGTGSNGLDCATDSPIVRKLMLDPDRFVRNYAVALAEKFEDLGPMDFEVLLDAVNIDCDNARIRAQGLIQSLSAKLAGCTPDSFALRVPLLRTDGLYQSSVSEFDGAGRWMEGWGQLLRRIRRVTIRPAARKLHAASSSHFKTPALT